MAREKNTKGSSPRVRGAALDGEGLATGLGIIPARAGSRSSLPHASSPGRDHPRACGEQPLHPTEGARNMGSSPRVRGAVPSFCCCQEHLGIIPARAGSSSELRRRGFGSGDHPRACGEQQRPKTLTTASGGSSPRVRGADAQVVGKVNLHGIIPARAGSR